MILSWQRKDTVSISPEYMCNFKPVRSKKVKAHGLPNSIAIDLAPYAGIIFSTKIKKKAPVLEDSNLKQSLKRV